VPENQIDVLRGHALAAALRKAKPDRNNTHGYWAWYQCCRHVAGVVVSTAMPLSLFYELCGVES